MKPHGPFRHVHVNAFAFRDDIFPKRWTPPVPLPIMPSPAAKMSMYPQIDSADLQGNGVAREVHSVFPSKILKQQWEENIEENRRCLGKNER